MDIQHTFSALRYHSGLFRFILLLISFSLLLLCLFSCGKEEPFTITDAVLTPAIEILYESTNESVVDIHLTGIVGYETEDCFYFRIDYSEDDILIIKNKGDTTPEHSESHYLYIVSKETRRGDYINYMPTRNAYFPEAEQDAFLQKFNIGIGNAINRHEFSTEEISAISQKALEQINNEVASWSIEE